MFSLISLFKSDSILKVCNGSLPGPAAAFCASVFAAACWYFAAMRIGSFAGVALNWGCAVRWRGASGTFEGAERNAVSAVTCTGVRWRTLARS